MDTKKNICILVLIVLFLCVLYSFVHYYTRESFINTSTSDDIEIVQEGQAINLMNVVQASQIKSMSDDLTRKIDNLTKLYNLLNNYQLSASANYGQADETVFQVTIEGEPANQVVRYIVPHGPPGIPGPIGDAGAKGAKGPSGASGHPGRSGHFIPF